MSYIKGRKIRHPGYSLKEEIFHAVSSGSWAALWIAGTVLMIVRAEGAKAVTAVSVFGAAAIIFYTLACVYHSLSPNLPSGRYVMRSITLCSAYFMAAAAGIVIALAGKGGAFGWTTFGIVCAFAVPGIVLTAIDPDRFLVVRGICLLGIFVASLSCLPGITKRTGTAAAVFLILGVLFWGAGAALYMTGPVLQSRSRYADYSLLIKTRVAVRICLLLGSFLCFWTIFRYLL